VGACRDDWKRLMPVKIPPTTAKEMMMMMKRLLLGLLLGAFCASASAEDKALATFTLGYVVDNKDYLETLIVTRSLGNGAYRGITTTGRQIAGVAAGNILCMSPVSRPFYGETWCFPFKSKTAGFVATFTLTYCSGPVAYQNCGGFSYPATVQRKKNADAAQAEPADTASDEQKLADAIAEHAAR
jgi:hypothetical protein